MFRFSLAESRLRCWHTLVCQNWPARTIFFTLGFITFAGWLLLLNSPHLGVNASLHWDAEESIVAGPAVGNRAVLDHARRHLYDVLPLVGSDDPELITKFFWSEKGLAYHDGLTQCRYYYSYLSDYLGHQAFLLGRRWFNTPTGAVLCYQLAATILVAFSMAMLLTYVVLELDGRRQLAARLGIIALTFAALASSPVTLSIARQMLTETVGFVFLVTAVVLCSGVSRRSRLPNEHLSRRPALIAGGGSPGLRAETGGTPGIPPPAIKDSLVPLTSVPDDSGPPLNRLLRNTCFFILTSLVGGCCFMAIRSRYTLGPAIAMLLPVIVLMNISVEELWRRRGWFFLVAVAFVSPLVALVAIDLHQFGPMFLPWVYDQVMVRSSKLMFHADPPYDDFILAMFVNLPLMMIPVVGVWCWIDQTDRPRSQARWCRMLVLIVFAIIALMLWRTAAQQVRYQGRHLFTFSVTLLLLLLLVLPRIRWRPAAAGGYIAVTGFFLVWNCYSTFGPQRRHAITYQADFITVVAHHLSPEGATAKKSLARDVWNSYFDWADDRLVHDSLLAWSYVNQHRSTGALVLLDSSAPKANQLEFYSGMFPAFHTCQMHGPDDPVALVAARAAMARGEKVFLFTAPGRQPSRASLTTRAVENLDLKSDILRQVTTIISGEITPP